MQSVAIKVFWLLQRMGMIPRYFGIDDSRQYKIIEPQYLRGGKSLVNAFWQGQHIFELLQSHLHFARHVHVLDVGCGDGRVASAFARNVDQFNGRYIGFDIDQNRVTALQRLFSDNEKFHFYHMDMYHSYYNPAGRLQSNDVQFVCDDNWADIIVLNSIFSHMKKNIIAHYLTECKRCIASHGKIWMTCYIVDDLPIKPNATWHFTTPYDEGFTATPNSPLGPEGCVGYPSTIINGLISQLDLKISQYIPGSWKVDDQSKLHHEQDLYILEK